MYAGLVEKLKEFDAIHNKELYTVKLVKKKSPVQKYFKEYNDTSIFIRFSKYEKISKKKTEPH